MNRREFLVATGVTAATVVLTRNGMGQTTPMATPAGAYALAPLPYAYDALEPFIDAKTMEIHHSKHHAAYVTNLNKALASEKVNTAGKSIEALISDMNAVPEVIRTAVRNNGGGHANHDLFWSILKRNENGQPGGKLGEAIKGTFGDYAKFSEAFTKQALGVFGSGWAWLSVTKEKTLAIEGTANQDSPLMTGNTPVLGLDVWEHAYYLKYQNRRAEYVKAFFSVINWAAVEQRFAAIG